MNFLDLAQTRRSVRSFAPKDVSQEDLLLLIKAAQSAPSAGNCQPWHFYVVRDRETRDLIRTRACRQEFLASAPVLIVVCAESKRNEARYGERGRGLYCIQDTAAAIQNILLCAHSLGLGACWCGAFDEAEVSKILLLQKDARPVAILPVGVPAVEPEPRNRRPVEEIMTVIGGEA